MLLLFFMEYLSSCSCWEFTLQIPDGRVLHIRKMVDVRMETIMYPRHLPTSVFHAYSILVALNK